MALNEEQQASLLRHLNGDLSPTETVDVARLLKEDTEARAFLRGVAEQAVVVADVERLSQHRTPTKIARPVFSPAKWAVAAAIALADRLGPATALWLPNGIAMIAALALILRGRDRIPS